MADEFFRNICGRNKKMSAGQHVLIGGSELDGGVRRRRGKGEEARRLPKASCRDFFCDDEIKPMLKFND